MDLVEWHVEPAGQTSESRGRLGVGSRVDRRDVHQLDIGQRPHRVALFGHIPLVGPDDERERRLVDITPADKLEQVVATWRRRKLDLVGETLPVDPELERARLHRADQLSVVVAGDNIGPAVALRRVKRLRVDLFHEPPEVFLLNRPNTAA
jgi:hypothetical protein